MQLYVRQLDYIINMQVFLKHKMPTLIEKPLTITTSEATKLNKFEKKKKLNVGSLSRIDII